MKKRSPYSLVLCCLLLFVGLYAPSISAYAHPQALTTFYRLQDANKREPTPLRSTQILEILLVQEECSRGVSSGKEYHQKFPTDLDLSLAYARLAICAHKYETAAIVLDEAEKIHGPSLQLSLRRLELFEAQGRGDLGALALKIVTSYDNVEPDIYLQAAPLTDNGKSSKGVSSLEILKRGIEKHPASISLWLALVDEQEKQGAVCDAAETVRNMRDQFPRLNKEEWDGRQRALKERCSKG